MQVVLCACGIVYTLCKWCHVNVALCIGAIVYMLYMWYYCTCGIVCMLCMLCCVHVVLRACHACCVMYMWYCVCELCSHGIMTCVFSMLYLVYIYVFYCTSSVGVCALLYIGCRYVLCCTPGVAAYNVWCFMLCVSVFVCDVHYLYVYVIEVKIRHWVLTEFGNRLCVCT